MIFQIVPPTQTQDSKGRSRRNENCIHNLGVLKSLDGKSEILDFNSSLLHSMNLALFIFISVDLMSPLSASFELTRKLPKCLQFFIQGSSFPHNFTGLIICYFWRKDRHLVLLFLRSGSVENLRPCLAAYSSQEFS